MSSLACFSSQSQAATAAAATAENEGCYLSASRPALSTPGHRALSGFRKLPFEAAPFAKSLPLQVGRSPPIMNTLRASEKASLRTNEVSLLETL